MATAGITVYIKQGTYNERLIPKNSGTAEAPISFEAYPGDSVTIEGTGFDFPVWNGLLDIEGLSYIRIYGLRVTHSPGAGIWARNSSHITIEQNYTFDTFSSGICAHTCYHVLISGNEVVQGCTGGDNTSIAIITSDGFQVSNNVVHDGIQEGIDAYVGCSNGIISGNEVYNQNASRNPPGIYLDAANGHEFNIDVFDNISHDNGHGFAVASENGGLIEAIKIHHNTAYNNSRGFTVAGWGPVASHPIKNIEVYGNTSYGNQFGFDIAGFTGTNFDGIKVYNNIIHHNMHTGVEITRYDAPPGEFVMRSIEIINNTIYGNGTSGGAFEDGGINLFNISPESILIRNNLISSNAAYTICVQPEVPSQAVTIDYNLIDGFKGAFSETQGVSPVLGDPAFFDAAGANFHLSAKSAAIDHGSPENAPAVDYDGNPRPQGNGVDIGAFEFTQ